MSNIHINIYQRLYHIKSLTESPNAILFINFNESKAYINGCTKDEMNEILNTPQTSIDKVDDVVGEALTALGLDFDGFNILLNLFINKRDWILQQEALTKQRLQEAREKKRALMEAVKNKEVQNIEYYGSYFGYKYIGDLSIECLTSAFNEFKRIRKRSVAELHHLVNIRKYTLDHPDLINDSWDRSRMEYNATMGLNYIYTNKYFINHCISVIDTNHDYVMIPLSYINDDYARYKIHVLEVELAYINRNIKAIKVVIRKRLKDKKSQPKKDNRPPCCFSEFSASDMKILDMNI